MKRFLALSMGLLLAAPVVALAQDAATKTSEGTPPYPLRPPTLANVRHGPQQGQVLDFSQTQKTTDHAPLLFYIHGGPWNFDSQVSALDPAKPAVSYSVFFAAWGASPFQFMAPMRSITREQCSHLAPQDELRPVVRSPCLRSVPMPPLAKR